MRHANVSIFVPHAGCPHQCSFCNQREISGMQGQPIPDQITDLCGKSAIPTGVDAEIAFFGGSFTALDRSYMISLLEAAFPFVENGRFSGIRVSTRPDAIDEHVLGILKKYGVTSIELGAQSMDDDVLLSNKRGHRAADVESAAKLIQSTGFSLGLQMMTGLWRSTVAKDLATAAELAALNPDSMRIYPTVVLEGTVLADLFRQGTYRPQTLEQAVDLCARLLDFFERRGIPVIRMGLHDEPSLRAARLAGPHHPAFRELCEGLLMARRVAERLGRRKGSYQLGVSPGGVSKMCGHGAFPVEYLRRLGYNVTIKEEKALSGLEFQII